jgi:hypothetical protein
MIFRLTQKASTKLGTETTSLASGHPSLLEWYCNLVVAQRRQFFLLTQSATLFSFWMPARGLKRTEFGETFRSEARMALRDYGIRDDDIARIIDDGPDVFGKAADRGVIGSMVDYAKMLQYMVDERGGLENLDPREMNNIANECPMSKIGMEQPAHYLREILRSAGTA